MVVFCASLLYDESVESSMAGKKLKTILTYQDAVIAEAIDSVLPETHHRVCVWHMYEHALKQLNHVFLGSGSFVNDLSSCVFDHEEDGDFVNA
jgi:zinc finger SWIM domain-containing protein 3